MENTIFNNPHGLDEITQNYSTAYDLSLLMKYAIKNKTFLEITNASKYKVKKYVWINKNKLLNNYKYTISGKIGYTKKAGQVFVSAAQKDNKKISQKDHQNEFKKEYTLRYS